MTNSTVYLGLWTNWSRGSIYGSTLTTSKEAGTLLVAFTASFIAFIPMKRLAFFTPLLLSAIICITGFTLAGGFSSLITSAVGDEVLVRSPSCGWLGYQTTNATLFVAAIGSQSTSEFLDDALNYAQQCYETSTSTTTQCNKFVIPQLPVHVTNTNADCPFNQSICRHISSNILMDTGYLDSNDHFGINAPPNERFKWRYIAHCAPLKTFGYTSHVHHGNRTKVRYHYGRTRQGLPGNYSVIDFIYEVDDIDTHPEYSNAFDGSLINLAFDPIPELVVEEGDITVVFLSGNNVVFYQPMDDGGWYQATTAYGQVDQGIYKDATTYRFDEAASVLGCVERYQICNSAYSGTEGCGPLSGLENAIANVAPKFNLTVQDLLNSTLPSSSTPVGTRLLWPGTTFSYAPIGLHDFLSSTGAKSLQSQKILQSGTQYPLPDNQWQLDVTGWVYAVLASFQAVFVNAAEGPNESKYVDYLLRPTDDEGGKYCNLQKIRSTAYLSFSVFGLSFTFLTGTLIVVVSFILEPIIACFFKRRKHLPYSYIEWRMNTALQLQRLAHEEPGVSKWKDCIGQVPITDPETVLANLNISDPEHPKLDYQLSSSALISAEGAIGGMNVNCPSVDSAVEHGQATPQMNTLFPARPEVLQEIDVMLASQAVVSPDMDRISPL
ncbi:hypothetical protein F5Y16DRAFT_417673 [Xylariaceae sp. FL0255]|nr:hypothetical protein F5Y16DRAFT_417673 [Xylariaceae sp. FL0255]